MHFKLLIDNDWDKDLFKAHCCIFLYFVFISFIYILSDRHIKRLVVQLSVDVGLFHGINSCQLSNSFAFSGVPFGLYQVNYHLYYIIMIFVMYTYHMRTYEIMICSLDIMFAIGANEWMFEFICCALLCCKHHINDYF